MVNFVTCLCWYCWFNTLLYQMVNFVSVYVGIVGLIHCYNVWLPKLYVYVLILLV